MKDTIVSPAEVDELRGQKGLTRVIYPEGRMKVVIRHRPEGGLVLTRHEVGDTIPFPATQGLEAGPENPV